MLKQLTLLGVFLMVSACGENLPKQDSTNHSDNKANASSGVRDINNNPLGFPGDPASAFDTLKYERTNESDPLAAIKLDFLRGGILYDTWWTFINGSVSEPPSITSVTHPAWPATINPNISGSESWRCSTCHGWDYLGAAGVLSSTDQVNYSGIKGIVQATVDAPPVLTEPALIYEFIHTGQTPNGFQHNFANDINDSDIYALTRFIATLQSQVFDSTLAMGPFKVIDILNKKVNGDQGQGYAQYHELAESGGCDIECHGIDGDLIKLGPTQSENLTTIVNDDPWRALHKVRFGQPGSVPFMAGLNLSAGYVDDFNAAVNTLAFAQVGLVKDYIRGGRLYENIFSESQKTSPPEVNRLWEQRDFSFDVPLIVEDTWTCSGCHGYDYLGQIGFDNNLLYASFRPWTEDYVFNRLSNGFSVRDWNVSTRDIYQIHDYKTLLSDDDLWDLVAFMMQGITDTYRYIYITWSSNGDLTMGREQYQSVFADTGGCVTCHGLDGLGGGITDNPTVDIFTFAWDKPWEFLHKTRFGVAGKEMPAIENDLNAKGEPLTIEDAANIHRYSQERFDPSTIP